jgi:type IX secretion system PorP/SprF family membrane protein
VKKLIPVIVILVLTFVNRSLAQVDPHFSQYYAYPLWLNPALTGIVDGDTRFTGNARDQWAGINGGYKTVAFSGDFRTTDKISLGFNMIDQMAGTAGYNYFAGYGSFAYQIAVSHSGYHRVNFGLQAGVINRSFDPSKLQLDDQYNSSTGYFDPSLPNFENFATSSATVFDASAGIFYYDGTPSNSANVFFGGAVSHLVPVKDPLATNGLNSRIPLRITIHGGVRIRASGVLDFTPHVLYVNEQQNMIRAAGMYMEFKLKEESSFILGGMYRLNDAAIANVGFHVNSMILGLSYDYNTSGLQGATNRQGGYELSLSYVFKKRVRIETQSQVCPRL